MNTLTAGNARLHEGREELRLAIAEQAQRTRSAEDVVYDAARLRAAQEHFEAAASLFDSKGRATDEAWARLGGAEVYLKMPLSDKTCTAAEASSRAAIALIDAAHDPVVSLEGYLMLGEAMVTPLMHTPEGFEKENRITGIMGVLRAAEYLAVQQLEPLLCARVNDYTSRVLGERFRGDRDRNLLDAIRAGERALAIFRDHHAESGMRYPSLQVHLGNCYMKLDGPRRRWLQEGLSAYRDGLAVVNAEKYPRLHRVLAGHVGMAEALILEGDDRLPEKEMMGRFGAKLQTELDAGDMPAAEAVAWETIQWAWSLDGSPNVWLGEGHKFLGTLLLQRDEVGEAKVHFYTAAAVLSAVSKPGGPQQAALLEGAKNLLTEAMRRLGQANNVGNLWRQINVAFAAARNHCASGIQLIESDPELARDEFERALALFPYDPVALFYRGVAAMSLADLEASLRNFDAVLRLQPLNVAALVNRAASKMRDGDVEGALTDYASVLEFDPNNGAALYNRAALHAAQGDCQAAITDLNRLIIAHPKMTNAYFQRADCYEHLGELEVAAADLARSLECTSDWGERVAIEAQITRIEGKLRGSANGA